MSSKFVIFIISGVVWLSQATAAAQDPDHLYALSVGSQLVTGQAIELPANTAGIVLFDFKYDDKSGPNANRGLYCEFDFEPQPFERILDPQTLTVTEVLTLGFSSRATVRIIAKSKTDQFKLECSGLETKADGKTYSGSDSYIDDLRMALKSVGGDLILPPPVHE
jgi:hypothetical protein